MSGKVSAKNDAAAKDQSTVWRSLVVFVDSYFDKDIGNLRNLLGAESSEELRDIEPQIVFANELE